MASDEKALSPNEPPGSATGVARCLVEEEKENALEELFDASLDDGTQGGDGGARVVVPGETGDGNESGLAARKNLESVKAGEMAYTVLQPVAVFAAEAIALADDYIRNGTVPETEKQSFDCILITQENVDLMTGPFTYSG